MKEEHKALLSEWTTSDEPEQQDQRKKDLGRFKKKGWAHRANKYKRLKMKSTGLKTELYRALEEGCRLYLSNGKYYECDGSVMSMLGDIEYSLWEALQYEFEKTQIFPLSDFSAIYYEFIKNSSDHQALCHLAEEHDKANDYDENITAIEDTLMTFSDIVMNMRERAGLETISDIEKAAADKQRMIDEASVGATDQKYNLAIWYQKQGEKLEAVPWLLKYKIAKKLEKFLSGCQRMAVRY